MREAFEKVVFPDGGSNKTYSPADLVKCFENSVAPSARRMSHGGLFRRVVVMNQILG